ncbi:hypothetical protein [Mucilaginibacter sp.]|uniref:hypothetical protein n=1 Tax=Mucilaginibacter sp. TaxID=1882438 RepID=UPI0032645E87
MDKLTFEKACKITGTDPNLLPGVEGLPQITAKRIIADYKLEIIAKATNTTKGKVWIADFNDMSQMIFTGWLQWVPSLGAFVFSGTFYTGTDTRLGARFWFKTRETAKRFTEQNIDLINDLHRVG